jgi:hypothetical protein
MEKIILNVRRHYGEIDWILPILYFLKKKYKIYAVFDYKFTFDNLKKNKQLFKIWKEVIEDYYIQDIKKKILLKFLNKFFENFLIKKFISEEIKYKLKEKIYSIKEIFYKFKISKKNLKFFLLKPALCNSRFSLLILPVNYIENCIEITSFSHIAMTLIAKNFY